MTTKQVEGGVGHATVDDAETAGRRAAERAVDGLTASPRIAYVFGSSVYDQAELVAGIDGVLDCSVIGCSTAGEIANGASYTESVVVLALGGAGVRPATGYGSGFVEDPRQAGLDAASSAVDDFDRDTVPMMVSVPADDGRRWYPSLSVNAFGPGLTGSKKWAVVGVQDALGWAQVSGGFAADDWNHDQTWVYRDGQALQDVMGVAALDVDVTVGTGVASGVEATEHTFTVTEAEDNRLHGLDGKPPLEVYRDRFDDPVINQLFLLTNPLGKRVLGGRFAPTLVARPDEEDGSVTLGEEPLEEGEQVALMETSPESIIEGTETAVEEAMLAAGHPDDIAAVLVFDASSRWYRLSGEGERNAELAILEDRLGADVPVAGYYGYGEVATQNALWMDGAGSGRGKDIHQYSIVVDIITNDPR